MRHHEDEGDAQQEEEPGQRRRHGRDLAEDAGIRPVRIGQQTHSPASRCLRKSQNITKETKR